MRNAPTEPERRLWQRLRSGQVAGLKFRRQSLIGPFIVDFHCPSAALVVEIDGHTHADAARDARRDGRLADMGLIVLRLTNTDVMRNIEGVIETIAQVAGVVRTSDDSPHPNPSPEGEGLSPAPFAG